MVDYPLVEDKKTGEIFYLDLNSKEFNIKSLTKISDSLDKIKNKKLMNESFQYEDILNMSFKDIIGYNNGDTMQTLRDLSSLMSRIQGTNEDDERKAYFKAKKFYEKLVAYDQNKNDKEVKKQDIKRNK